MFTIPYSPEYYKNIMQKTRMKHVLLTGCAALTLASGLGGCSALEQNHGNLVQEYQLERLQSSKHTKQSVLKVLGSPTTRAAFDDNVWYYIGHKTETYGVFEPEITDQTIVAAQFDDEGYLQNIGTVDSQAMNDLPLVGDETPTAGTDTNALQQFFGNLGRFNQPVGPASTTGDDTGGPGGPNR